MAGTLVTLAATGRLEQRRWAHERTLRLEEARRVTYGEMLRALTVWSDVTSELSEKPTDKEWKNYWRANAEAREAAMSFVLLAPATIVSPVDEALDVLLDAEWDYRVNGPDFLKPDALASRMQVVDRYVNEFRDLARQEAGVEPLADYYRTGTLPGDTTKPPRHRARLLARLWRSREAETKAD
jgi:hypothetical protein